MTDHATKKALHLFIISTHFHPCRDRQGNGSFIELLPQPEG